MEQEITRVWVAPQSSSRFAEAFELKASCQVATLSRGGNRVAAVMMHTS